MTDERVRELAYGLIAHGVNSHVAKEAILLAYREGLLRAAEICATRAGDYYNSELIEAARTCADDIRAEAK